MGKRILLVCNYYAPENTIAAVRTTKLVKYLRLAGYNVEVLTERKEYFAIDETLTEDAVGVVVYYATNSKMCIRLYKAYKRIIKPFKDKRMQILDNREKVNPKTGNIEFYPFETAYPIIGSFDYLAEQIRQRNLAKNAEKIINRKEEFDLIITSFGDSFSYFVGKKYKKKHKKTKWIFDIRDAVYRYKFVPDYVKCVPLYYEKYIWKHADAVVGVSKGICKRVSESLRNKVYYIPNGYDGTQEVISSERINSKMCFTYTGSMYGGLQNVSAFFIALKELIDNRMVEKDNIEVHYAGNPSAYEIFKGQASKGGLEGNCIFHGKLSRKESMELQRKSDMLLMASYDYKKNNGGIITGKLLEYMSANKPVISIVTGDIVDSEVSQIIRRTNIGFCYEEANKEIDLTKLKDYIFEQYVSYRESGRTIYKPVNEEKKKFDYSYLAKKYVKLINELEEQS